MTTKTAIIMKGISPPPAAGAPPAACAMASGINEFMVLSQILRMTRVPRASGGAYFGRKTNLCHRDLRGIVRFPPETLLTIVPQDGFQGARLDAGSQAAHQLEVIVQVVDGIESRTQDFIASIEVTQVGTGEIPAGVAGARRVEGTGVRLVGGIADVDHALRGEQVPVARVARRHHAVEHVDATQHRGDDVLWSPHTHEITRTVARHVWHQPVEYPQAFVFRFAHRQPADREPLPG